MFCPQCRAEYRPGFTHCTDCDVDLVNEDVAVAEYRQVRKSEPPHKLTEQLWRGADAHFYLGLMGTLGSMKAPCFGRPVNPPMYDSFEEQPTGSETSTEFEVLVSEENLPFARWILSSQAEVFKEPEENSKDFSEEPEEDVSPDVAGVCPLCFAEFTTLCSVCPNCGVPLRPAQKGALEPNPGRTLCNLPHPQFLADLKMALNRAGIPFNNANFPESPDTRRPDVAVLSSDFKRARKVLAQVLQYWEFDGSVNLGPSHDPRESYWPHRARNKGWYPEDLELLLWSGTSLGALDGIGMGLREHEIAYRVDSVEPGSAKIFIHPENEEAGREILRDVTEGAPPG
jgi:hypothetical protein